MDKIFIYSTLCVALVMVGKAGEKISFLSNIFRLHLAEVCTNVLRTYRGHRNVRTFLKGVEFIGLDDEYPTCFFLSLFFLKKSP